MIFRMDTWLTQGNNSGFEYKAQRIDVFAPRHVALDAQTSPLFAAIPIRELVRLVLTYLSSPQTTIHAVAGKSFVLGVSQPGAVLPLSLVASGDSSYFILFSFWGRHLEVSFVNPTTGEERLIGRLPTSTASGDVYVSFISGPVQFLSIPWLDHPSPISLSIGCEQSSDNNRVEPSMCLRATFHVGNSK